MLAKMIISGFLSKVHRQTLPPAGTIASGILARLNDTGGKPMNMKHLLSGVAVIAALAISAPVLAQTSSPPPASTWLDTVENSWPDPACPIRAVVRIGTLVISIS